VAIRNEIVKEQIEDIDKKVDEIEKIKKIQKLVRSKL
jgi:hypothetical protein